MSIRDEVDRRGEPWQSVQYPTSSDERRPSAESGVGGASSAPTVKTKSEYSEAFTAGTALTVPDVGTEALPFDIQQQRTYNNGHVSRSSQGSEATFQTPALRPSSMSDVQSTEVPLNTPSTRAGLPKDQLDVIPEPLEQLDRASESNAELSEILHKLGRISLSRDQLLLASSRFDLERQKAADARNSCEESLDALMQTLESLSTNVDLPAEFVQAFLLYGQTKTHLSTYKQLAQDVKSYEASLRNQEFELQTMDRELGEYIRASFPNLPQPVQSVPDVNELVSPPPDATPPALQAYWDILGEREHLRDELYDLDQQHRFDAAEFERMQELRVPPPRSESEFEREYEHKRHDLSRKLYDTNARAEHLHMDCVIRGIDPFTSRKAVASSSSSGTSLRETPHSDSAFYIHSLSYEGVEKHASRSTDNLQQLGTTAKVEGWLHKIDQRPRDGD